MLLLLYVCFFCLFSSTYQQENDDCSYITDCFNCSLTFSYCQWIDNKCLTLTNKQNISNYNNEYEQFSLIFSNCKKYFDSNDVISYCGISEINLTNNSDITISLPKNNGHYGTENLFCKYSIPFSENKRMKNVDFSLKLKNTTNDTNEIFPVYIKIDLRFLGKNEPFIKEFNSEENFNSKFFNVYLITIYFYSSITLSNNPFTATISIKDNKSKLIMYISISCIILVCLVIIIIICYINCKKLKKLNKEKENHNNEHNNQNNCQELYKDTDKQIEFLFLHSFNEIKYNKDLLQYGTNCTICLDDFVIEKSKVILTPCEHVFHYDCLKNWLHKNKTHTICPNCNLNFLNDERILTFKKTLKNRDSEVIHIQLNSIINCHQNNLNSCSLRDDGSERKIIKRNPAFLQNRNIG